MKHSRLRKEVFSIWILALNFLSNIESHRGIKLQTSFPQFNLDLTWLIFVLAVPFCHSIDLFRESWAVTWIFPDLFRDCLQECLGWEKTSHEYSNAANVLPIVKFSETGRWSSYFGIFRIFFHNFLKHIRKFWGAIMMKSMKMKHFNGRQLATCECTLGIPTKPSILENCISDLNVPLGSFKPLEFKSDERNGSENPNKKLNCTATLMLLWLKLRFRSRVQLHWGKELQGSLDVWVESFGRKNDRWLTRTEVWWSTQ